MDNIKLNYTSSCAELLLDLIHITMENKHMAMTQNFVRLVTEDTESDFLEFKQYKPDNPIKAEEQEQFSYTIFE